MHDRRRSDFFEEHLESIIGSHSLESRSLYRRNHSRAVDPRLGRIEEDQQAGEHHVRLLVPGDE